MEKRIRDMIKRVEKLELDLLSDEEIASEKKAIMQLIGAVQQELLRRAIVIAAIIVSGSATLIGLLSYPSAPMLFVLLAFVLVFLIAIIQYAQKYKSYCDLFRAVDILSSEK